MDPFVLSVFRVNATNTWNGNGDTSNWHIDMKNWCKISTGNVDNDS